jgi:PKD repeat protein
MHVKSDRPTHRAIRPGALVVALLVVAGSLMLGGDRASAQPGALSISAGGPYSAQVGELVIFTATIDLGGRPPDTETIVRWDLGDGTTEEDVLTAHAYLQAGTYQVTVTVSLPATGEMASDSTTVTITGGLMPGQLTASAGGPYSGQVGMPVTFTATIGLGGRPPGTPVQVLWDFGDGSTGTGATTTHTYGAPGTYTVTVTASIDANQTAMATTTAQIAAPASGLTVNAGGPYTGTVGQPVTFMGSVTGALLGTTVQYSWTFGDGGTGTGQMPMHTYTAPGTYTVTLTVMTTANQQGSASTMATITAAQSQGERVPLTTGCTNLTLTWPDGTPAGTAAAAVSPTGALQAVWRYSATQGRFLGYTPTAPAFANDLQTVNRLDAVFICVSSPATLNRPTI